MKRTKRRVDILTVIDNRKQIYSSLILRKYKKFASMSKLSDKRKKKKRIRRFIVDSSSSFKFKVNANAIKDDFEWKDKL